MQVVRAGFSLLEVMVGVVIASSLTIAIYKLQITTIASAGAGALRQAISQSVFDLSACIYATLNSCNQNTLAKIGACVDNAGSSYYAENSYSENTVLSTVDCSTISPMAACTDYQLAKYLLFKWKSHLARLNPKGYGIHAIVCRDSSLAIPEFANPRCDGYGPLVVKVVWQLQLVHKEQVLIPEHDYLLLSLPARVAVR